MRGAWTIFRREMKGYLQSPIATIVLIVFLLLNGGLFMNQFFLVKQLDMRLFFELLPFILSVILPAISMRLWSEDRQLNTLELLLSLPLRPAALVTGKFLAALAFFTAALASTWTIPLMLRLVGHPDLGPVATGYLGSFLLGALFLSIGQFVSGLCRDQIVSFIITMFACLGLYLAGTDLIAATMDSWWPGLGGFLQQHLGITSHFAPFQKGVLDGRDLAYFLLLVSAFLSLNGIWMEGRLRPRARLAFALACALSLGVAMAAQAVFQQLPIGRFDWTANRAYTISPVTREFLRRLELPATVKLYLSAPDKMPTAMRTLERSLQDNLEELRLISGGKFQYKIFHLEAVATAESQGEEKGESSKEKLGRRGIHPFQVQSIEADELGVRLVYAAASIAYKDRPEEVIPQIVPDTLDQFEYLLISKLYRMTLPEPPRIAVVAPYQERELDPALKALLAKAVIAGGIHNQQMVKDDYRYLPAVLDGEGYPVERIRLTEEEPIPPGTRALVVVEPGEMNDRQRYEINRFLVQGGSLLLAAQRYRFEYQQQGRGIMPAPREQTIGLDPLLEGLGVQIGKEILVDEQSQVLSISSGAMLGPFEMSIPVKSPIHILVGQDQMNPQLNITSQLSPILYLWGSPLSLQPDKLKANNLTSTTLFTSSSRSWNVSLSDFIRYSGVVPLSPNPTGRYPLAVLVAGVFPDRYSGQPVPDWPKEKLEVVSAGDSSAQKKKEEEPARPISQLTPQESQMILVGCQEMFRENLATTGGHLTFFLNAVDTLVTGGKLAGIRNKKPVSRAIPPVSQGAKAWYRFLILGLMPIAIGSFSLAHAAWRRRLREAYSAL
ncbi:MAG: Gldg family protein [Elusimicrobia bacterium]|nr:Gldg family protein [Elusimicrobiota bacterium]